MTRSYFLQLNNTDNLETVIKKCNTNFGSFSSTANRSTSDASTDVDLTSLIDDIEAERSAREAADADLDVLKAPLASPALTGTPTAPTAAAGTNTTQIATTAFVQNALEGWSGGGGGSSSGGGGDDPVGTIIDFAGATLPSGYLECDGSAVSRTDYADLFAVLGTTWGAGDGSTTFNLPDLRGRVSIGAGTGTADGATAHALASAGGDERMPAHSHGNTITATTPKFVHSVTQPAFNTPTLSHSITQPVFKLPNHTHPHEVYRYKSGGKITVADGNGYSWAAYNNTGNPNSLPNCTRSTNVAVGDHAAAACTRSTNAAVGDHAATACTMGGSVSSEGSGTAGNMQPFATVKKIIKATSNSEIETLSNSEIDAFWTAA